MKKLYDTIIIGGGVAGLMTAYKIAKKHKDNKTLLIEFGSGHAKRRRQLEGYFGCLPQSDGKLYINDQKLVQNITSKTQANASYKFLINVLSEVGDTKIIKDRLPTAELQRKITKSGFSLALNDYIQWKPESIHKLSRFISEELENASHISTSFDNEVYNIVKDKKNFIVYTAEGDFCCKNVVLCAGRSGWRWVNKLYKDLGILVNDDIAKFGIRVELPSQHMKEFNKSHCTLIKEDLEIGPFSWNGTVIPEDHADLVCSNFRSNEARWNSDKVSFSILGSKFFKDNGCGQTERLGKLAYLLSNDRIGKEKVRTFLKHQSQLSLLPEYNWLHEVINDLTQLIPAITTKGSFHMPNICPVASKIRLDSNLESEISGLYVTGESAGVVGLVAAGMMGIIVSNNIGK